MSQAKLQLCRLQTLQTIIKDFETLECNCGLNSVLSSWLLPSGCFSPRRFESPTIWRHFSDRDESQSLSSYRVAITTIRKILFVAICRVANISPADSSPAFRNLSSLNLKSLSWLKHFSQVMNIPLEFTIAVEWNMHRIIHPFPKFSRSCRVCFPENARAELYHFSGISLLPLLRLALEDHKLWVPIKKLWA